MRLDHLLSKETSRGWITVLVPRADCADVQAVIVPKTFLVVMRLWDTPVPIPNTTVKT